MEGARHATFKFGYTERLKACRRSLPHLDHPVPLALELTWKERKTGETTQEAPHRFHVFGLSIVHVQGCPIYF